MIITVVLKLFYDWPIYIFQYFVCILVTVLFGQGYVYVTNTFNTNGRYQVYIRCNL